MPFKYAIDKINGLNGLIEQAYSDAVKLDGEKLADSIRIRMVDFGTYSDGEDIGKANGIGYSVNTISIKEMKGQIYDHVTLQDTEDYHNSTKIQLDSNGFKVINNSENADELQDIWGREHNLLDLSDSEIEDFYNKFVVPILAYKIERQLQ